MSPFLKITGIALIVLFPLFFLVVSFMTGNSRYFLYALAASLAAVVTVLILKYLSK